MPIACGRCRFYRYNLWGHSEVFKMNACIHPLAFKNVLEPVRGETTVKWHGECRDMRGPSGPCGEVGLLYEEYTGPIVEIRPPSWKNLWRRSVTGDPRLMGAQNEYELLEEFYDKPIP